ncbi:PadR family transcriptional regulator [Candidatus Saccharibacteria bacterium]|jgi:PadR family transcriptional regulator PadR|nr:PadR family transcriptional regulator [Candidatus Saccharibacteria bacterium]
MSNTNDQDQIVRGMLYFAVLATLEHKESYGAQLLVKLEGTPFETKAGTLYPLMSRMQDQGLISSRWVIQKGKPPMRYYTITGEGQEKLQSLREVMKNINKVLGGIQ